MKLKDEMSELHIRIMNEEDFEIMVKWLNNSKVLEFYDGQPSGLNEIIKKYGPRIHGKDYVVPCIVEYKNKPIGYIQYYEIQEEELKKYGYPANLNIYGIDQFIGEFPLWGKGIGTSMVLTMLDYLSNKKNATKVVLEVNKNNSRAIACYIKCGFRKITELIEDLNLMEWMKTPTKTDVL